MGLASERLARKQVFVYGTFGLLFCLSLTLAPDLLPALLGHDGYVWTPVNSPLYRHSDMYYYAAWVAEGIQNGFPPNSPSATELGSKPLLETIRWFPLAVAALPSLVFSDIRTVFVLDYAFTACMFFGIPFYLSHRFTKNPRGSVLIGVLVLFYAGLFWGIFGGLKVLLTLSDSEELNAFRYIHISVSGPILMAYVSLCHVIYARIRPSYVLAGALLLLSLCMAFSYPSHTFIAYAALSGYAGLAYLRGHKQAAACLLTIGLIAASVLLFGGYVGYVRQTFADNELWNNIFSNEGLTLVQRPYSTMARMALVNRYTVTLSLAIWLAWKNRELRDMALLFGGIGCVLILSTLFDMPQLSTRFLTRGIDHLWLTVFAIASLWSWQERLKPWLLAAKAVRLVQFLQVTIFASILTAPAIGFGSYALASAKNLTRFMPEGRWEALDWINKNLQKRATVAALDWDDIAFIPIYTPANLVVNNMIIGGRGPADELKRYVALWKILGFPRNELEKRLTAMVDAASQLRNAPAEDINHPPLLEPRTYASSQIAAAVLYWPYVQKVGSIDIAEGGQTAVPFVNWAMTLYDELDTKAAVKDYPFSIVMLSGVELNLPLKAQIPLVQVFKNKTHTIYNRLEE